MNDIRIVFMGTPDFACNILQTLINNKYNIVCVITQPDKPVGRKKILEPTPVKVIAQTNNIDVLQPINIKEDYKDILEYKPDIIITCAYGQIIPKDILEYPKYKCINIHASLLPKYRGGAPIHYAIINGDTKTGITIMNMVEKMDAGDILVQEEINIDIKDTTEILFNKLSILGSNMIIKYLDDYINNKLVPIKQDESKVSYAYNITRDKEFINFNREVLEVYNHIRGLISWPIGYSIINDIKIKFYDIEYISDNNSIPLKVYGLKDNKLQIGCINGYILVNKLQVAGKTIMDAKIFYNGYKNRIEDKYFEEYIN